MIEIAVRVKNDDHVWRILFEVLHPGLKGKAFATLIGIKSFDDFDTRVACDGYCRVIAIVGNNDNSVTKHELRLNVKEGFPNSQGFVVGRD
jgi:hypothetical protein